MHRSDPKLIQSCLAGNRAAWDELIDRYGRLVYSIVVRYGMGEADADDIFQSVFVILFRRLDRLKDQTRLSAWLITTTHRECWRLARRRPGAGSLDPEVVDPNSPDENQVTKWEQQHLVRLGLERLGGRCRDLLEALFLEPADPDYEAIGARLKMPVGSIGPTRARCFKKLEKLLLELGLGPSGEEGSP